MRTPRDPSNGRDNLELLEIERDTLHGHLDHVIATAFGQGVESPAHRTALLEACRYLYEINRHGAPIVLPDEPLGQGRIGALEQRVTELETRLPDTTDAMQYTTAGADPRPHSRACGILTHDHGTACSTNCPTCHGLEITNATRIGSITQAIITGACECGHAPEGHTLDGRCTVAACPCHELVVPDPPDTPPPPSPPTERTIEIG